MRFHGVSCDKAFTARGLASAAQASKLPPPHDDLTRPLTARQGESSA
jgi:hypothetical protein